MDYVDWDERMSIGVDALDGDHRRLLSMFNGLLADGVSDRSKDDLSALLADLHDYTDVHFRREEAVMEACGYPDLDRHRAAHRAFVDEVDTIRRAFDADPAVSLRIDLILLLRAWLIDHIRTVDRQAAPFLDGKGSGSTAGPRALTQARRKTP